jgi:5-methylcytosine-specific restriction endonuclease McrA
MSAVSMRWESCSGYAGRMPPLFLVGPLWTQANIIERKIGDFRPRSAIGRSRNMAIVPAVTVIAANLWTTRANSVNHIMPKSLGGNDTLNNLRAASAPCNNSRDATP